MFCVCWTCFWNKQNKCNVKQVSNFQKKTENMRMLLRMLFLFWNLAPCCTVRETSMTIYGSPTSVNAPTNARTTKRVHLIFKLKRVAKCCRQSIYKYRQIGKSILYNNINQLQYIYCNLTHLLCSWSSSRIKHCIFMTEQNHEKSCSASQSSLFSLSSRPVCHLHKAVRQKRRNNPRSFYRSLYSKFSHHTKKTQLP